MCEQASLVTVRNVDEQMRQGGPAARRIDALLALAVCLFSVSLVVGLVDGTGSTSTAIAVAGAPGGSRAWPRKHPEAVVAVMAATGLVFVALGNSAVALGPGVLVGIYTVAAYRPPGRSVPVTAGATVAMLVAVAGSGAKAD